MEDLLAVQTVHNQHRSEKTRSSWEKINTPMQQKAFFKLSGFQYKICYKKGTTNLAADAEGLTLEVYVPSLWYNQTGLK
jgi:hypothetical protein